MKKRVSKTAAAKAKKKTPVQEGWIHHDQLRRWEKNPRVNEAAVKRVAKSIRTFGFVAPIIVWRGGDRMVAGDTRLQGIRLILSEDPNFVARGAPGPGMVRVVFHEFKNESEANAYAVADNRLNEIATWNEPVLAEVMQEYREEPELIDTMGYRYEDFFDLDGNGNSSGADDGETVTEISKAIQRKWQTKLGQVWLIPSVKNPDNTHRILIGDSKNPDDVKRLMNGKTIDFLFTSPPYNVGVKYATHDDTQVPWSDYREFLKAVLDTWLLHLPDGRAMGWNIGSSPKTFHPRQHTLIEECGMTFYRQLVWRKPGSSLPLWSNTEKASLARVFTPNYTHELVLIFQKGDLVRGKHVEPDALLTSDVFDLATMSADIPRGRNDMGQAGGGPNSGLKGALKTLAVHPAPFPVRLPLAFIKCLSDVDSVVAEPFCGSGTTIIAAELSQRAGYGMEIDPMYAAGALERMQKRGLEPRLEK